jgi:hypothetical protein
LGCWRSSGSVPRAGDDAVRPRGRRGRELDCGPQRKRFGEYPVSAVASFDAPRAERGCVGVAPRQGDGAVLFDRERLCRRLVLHGGHLRPRHLRPPRSELRRLQLVHHRRLQGEHEHLREYGSERRPMRGFQPAYVRRPLQSARAMRRGTDLLVV